MRLLPSEKEVMIKNAIATLEKYGELCIDEPCDCGSHVRHNNGGNYHTYITLRKDSGKTYVKYETSSELESPAEWGECDDPHLIIRSNADWL